MQKEEEGPPPASEQPGTLDNVKPDSEQAVSDNDKNLLDSGKPVESDKPISENENRASDAAPDSLTNSPEDLNLDKKVTKEPGGHHVPEESRETTAKPPSSPPESVFKKLKPSRKRYTFVQKDEL